MTNLHLILPPYSVFMYRSLEPRTSLRTELNSVSMKLSKDRDTERKDRFRNWWRWRGGTRVTKIFVVRNRT